MCSCWHVQIGPDLWALMGFISALVCSVHLGIDLDLQFGPYATPCGNLVVGQPCVVYRYDFRFDALFLLAVKPGQGEIGRSWLLGFSCMGKRLISIVS
ncbi:hypothetical protein BD779DRAFT_1562679, partial [Infundibulicybe gibba]